MEYKFFFDWFRKFVLDWMVCVVFVCRIKISVICFVNENKYCKVSIGLIKLDKIENVVLNKN